MFCDVVDLVGKLAFGLAGWLVGLVTPILGHWATVMLLGPKLSLSIDCDLAPTEKGERKSLYVRVMITNTKARTAIACRAYLVGVDEWDRESQAFVPTVYSAPLPLIWSYYPSTETFDIPPNLSRAVDIVRYVPETQGFDLQLWNNSGVLRPLAYDPFLQKRGTFRFTVSVSAMDIPSRRLAFKVTWDGDNWPPRVEEDA
jgi:hypothetical protein